MSTSQLSCAQLAPDQALPERAFAPDNVQLMLYNAVLWNGHRIHFDEPYTKEVEGYPGLVIAGPLLGDWMHQCLDEWLGDDGEIASFEYSNRLATYIGETLSVGGQIQSVDQESKTATIAMHVRNAAGENAAPGLATVRLHV